jgi:hypothetical protein
LALVDALVDGVAVIIHCILFASDGFRNNRLNLVGKEAINRFVGINNEVEATGI